MESLSNDGPRPERQVPAQQTLTELDDAAWSCLQLLARALRINEADREATLTAIARTATTTIEAAEAAGINLMNGNQFVPQAVHGEAPPLLDQVQQRTGEGPCIDASRNQRVVEITDMHTDSRWPEFTHRAADLGVRAMLCLPLWIEERSLGSLSLYASHRAAFDDTARRLAELFATHAALALGDAQRTERLRRAASNRDTIGQAKGILMERHGMTADEAHELLVDASQRTNRKVIDLAHELASTGRVIIP